jgi:AcrR family transcriptional regulator
MSVDEPDRVKSEEAGGYRASNRERQRLETRRRVYDAAMAEFRGVGVAAAQIEDIIKAAGVARGTFYNHYPTKDHVLLEYVERLQQNVADRLVGLNAEAPRPFFRGAVDVLLDVVAQEDPAILREALSVIGRHVEELENGAPLFNGLTAFFEAAQARGDIRSDLMPAELSVAFLPGVFGLLLLRVGAPQSELRKTLHHAVDVFVRGIAP